MDEIQRTYNVLQSRPEKMPEGLLQELNVKYRVAERDLESFPSTGAVLVVANHPYGILEGAILATVLGKIRPDVRFLANGALECIPEIRDLLVSVDLTGRNAVHANAGGLRRAIEFLRNGGCLVVFPAGEVSHFQWRQAAVADSEWTPVAARLAQVVARQGAKLRVVPVHIDGANSLMFQTLGAIHPALRTAMLVRELANKRGHTVDLHAGRPIEAERLLEIPTVRERTEYLRWRTDLLANRNRYKPRTTRRFGLRRSERTAPEPVVSAASPSALETEIAALSPNRILTACGGLQVYLAPAPEIPTVMGEIGRLRETTFRRAGEGTGKPLDLDEFDERYLHLFAWHPERREIAGAYRLAGTDQTPRLYTSTLFEYGEPFLKRLGPALELGRSFVRQEYQRSFAALLALWKGIGKYIALNPRYKVLFGPVSISNAYHPVSRELIVTFLEKYAALRTWKGLVTQRNPFRRRAALASAGLGVDDLSDAVADLEPDGAGVPVMLRQYLRLGGKLLGFNVDPAFSDALDGLIFVDLTKTERKLLERYLGKSEARQFLAFQEAGYASQ